MCTIEVMAWLARLVWHPIRVLYIAVALCAITAMMDAAVVQQYSE